ncbi:MAG: 3-hydroxyacyl-CoA dehydrogenase NAD-binding domain-containing protein, partial [Promethearchaeota archaeon]
YNVVLVDVNEKILNKGVSLIEQGLKKLESKNQLNGNSTGEVLSRLTTSTNTAVAVKEADFVIEAVIEDLDIKKQVFKTCDENSPASCILASNTSTMSITEIAKATNRPDKVIGMHFFNPPILMRLIEIIYGEKSSDEAIDTAIKIGENLPCLRGKRYIAKVLKDRPGFIVNRINAPVGIYLNWIYDQAAEKGIPWEQIDADTAGVMPMGPCELADYTGLDLAIHAREYYAKTLSPDFKAGKVITKLVNEGKTGRKSGQGFYDWSKGRPKIDKSKKAGLFNPEIALAIMLNEGCRLLEEGVVSGYKIIDEANLAGMNTPGPFGAGKKNYEKWTKMLDELADKTGKEYLRPCELMRTGGFLKMKK